MESIFCYIFACIWNIAKRKANISQLKNKVIKQIIGRGKRWKEGEDGKEGKGGGEVSRNDNYTRRKKQQKGIYKLHI